MIREHLISKALRGESYFRWRGGDVSRVEALSDMVFAFALTLIVVALDVPRHYEELEAAMLQFPVFVVCFVLLLMCWFYHFQYHRRFGFEDFKTIVLNAGLLFVILFYVYPLKFLFSMLYSVMGPFGSKSEEVGATVTAEQARWLMVIYGVGFAAIFVLYYLMYWRAWRHREALELDEVECQVTRNTMNAFKIYIGVAGLSVVLTFLPAPRFLPGTVYFLLGPLHFLNGYFGGRKVERLYEQQQAKALAAGETAG